MFDISFTELLIIAVVGLLVIGPDKLPQVARTLGAYMGRMQRYVAQVKEEINREARFEDLQNLQQEIKDGARQVKSSIMDGAKEAESAIAAIEDSVKPKRQVTKANTVSPSKKAPVKRRTTKSLPMENPSAESAKKPIKKATTHRKSEKA